MSIVKYLVKFAEAACAEWERGKEWEVQGVSVSNRRVLEVG